MAGPVAAARTSLPTYPPGHSGSSPQAAAPPLPILPSSQLVTAPTPQSASGKPRLPIQLALSMLPDSSVGFSAPPSLLSLAPFLLAARVDPYFHPCRPDPVTCPLPTCPSSSWPKDTAIVCCSLQGPLLGPHSLSCLYVSHLLFPLPGILFSATISLANCYFSSKTQFTSSGKASLTFP